MLPDLIAEKLTVIFCGINPGLKSAEEGITSPDEVIVFGKCCIRQVLHHMK